MMWATNLYYSVAGLTLGFVVGLILRPYLDSMRYTMKTPAQRNPHHSRRKDDHSIDLSKRLTVIIFVMMLLTLGDLIKSNIQQANDRAAFRSFVKTQVATNQSDAQKAGVVAQAAKDQSARTNADEKALRHLVIAIVQAAGPTDVARALHKFLRQSHQINVNSPKTTTTDSSNPLPTPSQQTSPAPIRSTHPPPQPTHHPSPKPTHHPSPKPSSPAPLLPVNVCSISVLGHHLC
jgi:hypothetical protein